MKRAMFQRRPFPAKAPLYFPRYPFPAKAPLYFPRYPFPSKAFLALKRQRGARCKDKGGKAAGRETGAKINGWRGLEAKALLYFPMELRKSTNPKGASSSLLTRRVHRRHY